MCAQNTVGLAAERNVNVDAVSRVRQPTRDVLVVRALDGDRTFAGFGKVRHTESVIVSNSHEVNNYEVFKSFSEYLLE